MSGIVRRAVGKLRFPLPGGPPLSAPSPARPDWRPFALFAVLAFLVVVPALSRGALPLPPHALDEVRAGYTIRQELTERLRAGEGAEWLHDVGFGAPGVRLVSWGVWSPFHAPAWVLPPGSSWTLGMALRLLVVMAGAWAAARELGGRRAVGYGAAATALLVMLTLGAGTARADTMALFPALAWSTALLMRRRGHWWHGIPMVAVAAATWLAGSPTAAMVASAALLAVAAARLWPRRREPVKALLRPLGAAVMALGLGVGLAGFTLVPSLELLRDGTTRAVVRAAQGHQEGLRPVGTPLLTTVQPDAFTQDPPRDQRLARLSVRGRVGATTAVAPRHVGLSSGVAIATPESLTDPRGREILRRAGLRRGVDSQWQWTGAEATRVRAWLGMLGIAAVLEPAPSGAAIREIRPALPTVLVTRGVLPASDGGAVHAMERSGVEGLLRNTVVEPYESHPLSQLPGGDGSARLASASRAGGHVLARVQSDRGAVLVVLDRALPGWEASVDGKRDTVLRANGAFIGAPVPPGTHVVELRYAPPGAVLGVITSMRAIGGVAGWLLLRWLRERTGMSTRQLLLAAAHEGQRRWIHRRR